MTSSMAEEVQDVCASDPNFAVIFAFCERFGDSCGVTIPTFQELQEMLENTNQVPDALVDLHIKLLRRVKKSVHVDKWERAILKFCQGYSIPEIWELERYGYKGISIQLKLKILKTLFEAQFDSNPKFKAEINKLESSTLRSQPLGWDKLGTAYWLQFDRACNLRVYREDTDEDTWKIVAKDRSSLVNLINELSGVKDDTLDDIEDSNSIETDSDAEVELSPGLDQEVNSPTSVNSTPVIENIKKECKVIDSTNGEAKQNPKENPVNFKRECIEDVPIVGETIEESVMIVKGEGSGNECDTGNPDEANTQNEASKNEDVKKPKLWSIETICSSSKEVQEEIISVPTTGFFFGDDSVPCFNNVSNGESSHTKEEKLIVDPLKENDEKLKNKTDEIDSTTLSHSDESLNKERSFKNEDDLSTNNISKQSVFNIKVHEEEVQITERKANEVFTKSNSSTKEDTHQTNLYIPSSIDTHSKLQESQLHQTTQDNNDDTQSHTSDIAKKCDDTDLNVSDNIYESKIIDKHKIISDSKEVECTNIEVDQQSTERVCSHINVDKQTEQVNKILKSDVCSKEEPEKQLKNDHQSSIKITDSKTDEHIFDSKVEIDKQLINETNQNDEVEKISSSYEIIKSNESPTNILNKCVDLNEQKCINVDEQNNSRELDKKLLSNVLTENQILVNKSSIIISEEEAITNLISEDNEIDKQVSEEIVPIQITESSVTNSTYSNYVSSQHNPNECLPINATDLNSKAHDQTKIDVDQINKKPKNTSHNISNIINTEMVVVSNNVKVNEQSTNTNANENKQLGICQIINKDNLEKNINLEEKKIVMNVNSQVVSNNKHSLDNILKKSEENKDMVEFPSLENKATKQNELTNKPATSSSKIDLQKTVEPEINIEKLDTKCMDVLNDLTIITKCNLKENNKSIALEKSNIQENKILETINQIPSEQEKEIVKLIEEIPSAQEKKLVDTMDKIQSINEKGLVKTIDIIPSEQEKKIIENIDKISNVQEKEIVKNIDKLPSVQEKEIVKNIDKIPSVQEKEIVKKIDKIPSVQEKEIVEKIDKIPSVQEKEMVKRIDKIPSIQEKEIVKKIDKIPSVQEKEIVKKIDKIPSVQEKETVKKIDEIPSIQEKEIVKKIDKIPSVQEKEMVKRIDKIPSVQEKEIVKKIDKIPSVQEKEIVKKIDKIPSVQEKETVKKIDEIPSIQEKEIVKKIDKIPSVQEKEMVKRIDKIPSIQEKEIVKKIDKIPSVQEKEIVKKIDKVPSVQEQDIVKRIDKIPSEQEKEIVDTVDKTLKIVKIDDEHTVIPLEQCSKDTIKEKNFMETKQKLEKIKENQKEISSLTNAENENDTFHKKKLNLEEEEEIKNASDYDENLVFDDSSVSVEVSKKLDKENTDEALQNANKSSKDNQFIENEVKKDEVKTGEDIKIQSLKLKKDKKGDLDYTQDLHEKNILKHSEEQEVSSPVHEDMYDSNNETNDDTFIENSSKELDNSDMMDPTIEEDDKKSDEEIEEVPKKKGRPGRKKGKRGRAKKINTVKQDNKSNSEEKVKRSYKPRKKKVVTIAEEVTVFPEPAGEENIRRSRRIAEIKIKEQFVPIVHYDDIDIPLKTSKKKDKGGRKGSKKGENVDVSDEEDEEDPISIKFKKKKRKGKSDSLKKLNVRNPWNVDSESSSSENNIGLFEDYDHDEEDEIPRPGIEPNVSDHEFSPESDINDDDEEYLPEKRARTAHKKDEDEQLKDDMPCQKCNKSDQPEWILLCDTCNQGWHASCLRPALMIIPDGDWYCPHCRHEALLNALKDTLKKYDGDSKKRENEELRRKRLAYVGISLQNVITSKTEEVKTEKPKIVEESSEEEEEEESESESYDSEPLYQLRARRQANVSYRFNDYDDMINEAILEETGVDESAARKSIDLKKNKNDNDEKTDSGNDENDKDREDSPIAPALLHLRGRKKSKKLTNLDISSDDGSDEDFKGPSDGDDDYEEDLSDYSDDSIRRQPQPTRRSVRNRKTVVDPDFINDDSSEESDHRSKKKRSRPWSESSNSEEEDFTWGKKKKKRTNAPSSSSLPFKQNKGLKRKRSENDKFRKPKKSKVKYGMDLDSDSDGQPKRRTRGRQITYAESDDSEEEVQTKKRKVVSDEEDEYVLNEEELEAENEDQKLEVEEDVMASNDEKDEELDEEDVVEEVEEEEEEEEEEDEPKLAAAAVPLAPQIDVKSPSAIIQSVIRGPPPTNPISSTPSSMATDFVQDLQQNVHQRLLPPVIGATPSQANKQLVPPLSVVDSAAVGTIDKRKRPSQLKKSPSPNSSVDYGGNSSYPFPPDATKVVVSSLPLTPPVHVPYNRPPATTGGFKAMAGVQPPPGGFPVAPAPYRTSNKISTAAVSTPAYLPQQHPSQVQQVYQTPPLPTNYSPYPIDYANSGTPLPPPPPSIAFRNVVTAPTSHEPLPPTPSTQQSGTAGGDSEFGGLVSYFSSQQEDDFDT